MGRGTTALTSAVPAGERKESANAVQKCALVQIEIRLVQLMRVVRAVPHAEPAQCPRYVFEVPREVLTAAGLLGLGEILGPDGRRNGLPQLCRAVPIIDDGWNALLVGEFVSHVVRGEQFTDRALHHRLEGRPRLTGCTTQSAHQFAGLRNGVTDLPRVHLAPGQDCRGTGIDAPVQYRGQPGDQHRGRVNQITGQVRPRGVAARRPQTHGHRRAGGRDRSGARSE